MHWRLLAILMLATPSTCLAASTTVQATDVAEISDPGNGIGELLLLKFEIPEAVAKGTITRATLEYAVDCGYKAVTIWVHPAPADWSSASALTSWWSTASPVLQPREIAEFESSNCYLGLVRVDVARWVREWAEETRENYGFLIRRPPGVGELASVKRKANSSVPELRIVYRPGE